jgi:hypothetical protein
MIVPADKAYIIPGGLYPKVRLAAGAHVWCEDGAIFDGEATDTVGFDFSTGSASIIGISGRREAWKVKRYGDNGQTDDGGSFGTSTYTIIAKNGTIENCQGANLVLGPASWVYNVLSVGGERYGWKAFGSGSLVEKFEVVGGNSKHYSDSVDAGACKLLWSNSMLVDYWAHGNFGNGLWPDGAGPGNKYERCLLEGNTRFGLSHEFSDFAEFRNITAIGNGVGAAQCKISSGTLRSSTLVGDVIAEDDPRGTLGIWEVDDCDITIFGPDPHRSSWGFGSRWVTGANFASYGGVKYGMKAANRYKLTAPAGRYFRLVHNGSDKKNLDWTQWRALGQDPLSSLV